MTERERDRVISLRSDSPSEIVFFTACVCVCVCVCVRERERDRVISQRNVQPIEIVLITACVFVCDRERERQRETGSYHCGVYSPSEIALIAACLQTHTASSLCLSHDSVPLSGLN